MTWPKQKSRLAGCSHRRWTASLIALVLSVLLSAARSPDSVVASGPGGGGIAPVPPQASATAPPPTFVAPPNRSILTMMVTASRRVAFVLRDDTGSVVRSIIVDPGRATITLPIDAGEVWTLTVVTDDVVHIPVTAGQRLQVVEMG